MENLIDEFPKSAEIVADLFSGTFATSKMCFDLPRSCCSVGRKAHVERFAAKTELVVEKCRRQVSEGKSIISDYGDLVDALKILDQNLDSLPAKKRISPWKEPTGLCSAQTFSLHLMHFLANMFLDPSLSKKGRKIPFNQSSSTWLGRFHQLKADVLHSAECSASRVIPKK